MDLLQPVVAQIVDAVGTGCALAYSNTPTFLLPLLPYWSLVVSLLALSPFTMILPQLLQGKLEWPRGCGNVWVIHGKRYDLTPFYDRHPGGKWILRTAKGSDCTALFESYHSLCDRKAHLAKLAEFELPGGRKSDREPELVTYEEGEFDCAFFEELKQMVRKNFRGKGKYGHKMATPNLLVAAAAWVLMQVLIVQLIVYDRLWCIPFVGVLAWYMMGIVMHDASHLALVSSPVLNRIFAYAPLPYCMNISAWHIQHGGSHHIYTNERGDLDLYHLEPLKRFLPGGKRGKKIYALHVIVLMLLASTAIPHLAWVVPVGILGGHIDPSVGRKMYAECRSIACHRAELWFPMSMELVVQAMFFVWCYSHQGFIKGLCVTMSVYSVVSACFTFFTLPSHFQEGCFKLECERSWAKRQVISSVDFRPDSHFWGHVSGGLNTQSLHHVFPCVSATHLRAMYPEFRRICKKHGVEQKETESLSAFVQGFIDTAY